MTFWHNDIFISKATQTIVQKHRDWNMSRDKRARAQGRVADGRMNNGLPGGLASISKVQLHNFPPPFFYINRI